MQKVMKKDPITGNSHHRISEGKAKQLEAGALHATATYFAVAMRN